MLLFLFALLPGVSFLGHLSGIICGYLYMSGPLKRLQPSSQLLRQLEGMLPALTSQRGFVSHDDANALPLSTPPSPSTLRSFPGIGQLAATTAQHGASLYAEPPAGVPGTAPPRSVSEADAVFGTPEPGTPSTEPAGEGKGGPWVG